MMILQNLIMGGYKRPKQLGYPAICITFDDGFLSDYDVAYADMTTKGLKGTSYINPARVGNENRLTWGNAHTMINSGNWDIQCHGYNHEDLTSLTEAEIITNMEDVNDAFLAEGLGIPKHHALPFGYYSPEVMQAVKQYRDTIRHTGSRQYTGNSWGAFFTTNVMAVVSDLQDAEHLDLVKIAVDRAIADKSILFLYGHRILVGAGQYQTDPTLFTDMTEYISAADITSMTVSELYDAL